MKFSVAPESTSTCLSAFECAVLNRVGIRRLLYLHLNTLFVPKARAQTDGLAPFKNPLHLKPPYGLSPLCLLQGLLRPFAKISFCPI